MTTETPISILVVEYDDTMRGLLYDWLRVVFPHHQIISAPNVDEAIAAVDSMSPPVILVDTNVPEDKGADIMRCIKAAAPEAEVIAMTTKDYPAYHNEYVSAGAEACVNLWHICQELLPMLTDLLGDRNESRDVTRSLPGPAKHNPHKVVYIEDDPEALYLIKRGLERSGLELITAEGGRAGLKAIRRAKPDLILLDLMMPQFSGWDVYQEVQADDEIRNIPILLVTALGRHCDEVKSLDVYGHITKPFTMRELLREVSSILKPHPA